VKYPETAWHRAESSSNVIVKTRVYTKLFSVMQYSNYPFLTNSGRSDNVHHRIIPNEDILQSNVDNWIFY